MAAAKHSFMPQQIFILARRIHLWWNYVNAHDVLGSWRRPRPFGGPPTPGAMRVVASITAAPAVNWRSRGKAVIQQGNADPRMRPRIRRVGVSAPFAQLECRSGIGEPTRKSARRREQHAMWDRRLRRNSPIACATLSPSTAASAGTIKALRISALSCAHPMAMRSSARIVIGARSPATYPCAACLCCARLSRHGRFRR